MADVARQRAERLVQAGMYASVDDVPVFAWKTPLQRSIQILKRHRDVMFWNSPNLRPISMIITTLSAHALPGRRRSVGCAAGDTGPDAGLRPRPSTEGPQSG